MVWTQQATDLTFPFNRFKQSIGTTPRRRFCDDANKPQNDISKGEIRADHQVHKLRAVLHVMRKLLLTYIPTTSRPQTKRR